MKNRKTTLVKIVGKLALVAGLMGATVAVPKISSAATKTATKPANAMMAKKPAVAVKKKAAPKTEQVTGSVTSIKGNSLTIAPVQKNKKGASKTVSVPATAKVTLNGKAAKLSQVKAGDKATIKMSDSKVTSVEVTTAKKAASKKATSKKVAPKKASVKKAVAPKAKK